MKTALVLGGSGFIGSHMARRLKSEGYWVRTVDIKEYPYGDLKSCVDDYVVADLRDRGVCKKVFIAPGNKGFDEVYQFSAFMGGAGIVFTGDNDARIMYDSGLLNLNAAEACRISKAKKVIFSSSACFLPGIYVTTNFGGSKIEAVEVGDKVLTHTGKFERVLKTSVIKHKGIIKNIKIPGYPVIQCTEEHPFLIDSGHWKKASELNIGDRVVLPIPKLKEDNSFIDIEISEKTKQYIKVKKDLPTDIPLYSKQEGIKYHNIYNWLKSDHFSRVLDPVLNERILLDGNFGELIGFYLANGWVERGSFTYSPRLLFSFGDTPHYKSRLAYLLNKCLGIPYNRIHTIEMKNQKGSKLEIVSQSLFSFFLENFYDGRGMRAVNKQIPIYLMNSKKEFLRGLIKGYWSGDGNVYTKKNRTRISNSTVSLNLNCGIRIILNYLGISVSLVIESPKSHKYKNRIIKGNYDAYQSYIVGKESKRAISDILDIKDIKIVCSKSVEIYEDKFTLPIISIEDGYYQGDVFNMEVEEDNSYTVYGVAVHNCVYNQENQKSLVNPTTSEESAFPAYPDSPYGWEKIFSETMWESYARNYGLDVRITRFHNIFGECFDDKTEIMTSGGFKKFKEVTFDDKIMTRNPESEGVEFHKPLAIQNFDYNGLMYNVESSAIDMVVTPDHSMYVSTLTTKTKEGVMRGVKTSFSLKRMEDVQHSRIFLRSDLNWNGGKDKNTFILPEVKQSDGRRVQSGKGEAKSIPMTVWLKFLGIYLAEGSCFKTPTNYTVALTKHNTEKVKEIMQCVESIGFSCNYDGKSVIICSKQLWDYCKQFGHAKEKFIPREFLDLKKGYLQILFDSLMSCDGDRNYKERTSYRYSTASYQLASDVQELTLKIGLQAWVGKEESDYYYALGKIYEKETVIYRVHICKRLEHCIKRYQIKPIEYTGSVYDVTVPNHIIFVRRNGKCVWSGNCGAWGNRKEKSPAAMCRKVAEVNDGDTIEVWGDGNQTRSFLYIDECLNAVRRLMDSDYQKPINIGSDEMVSINDLVEMVKKVAGKPNVKIKHVEGPLGVRGRNSDNNLIKKVLNWAPDYPLIKGIEKTYPWIKKQVESGVEDCSWSN